MAADNVKRFEVRLGKWGLGIFVCGMALLMFCSFLFGVMVGTDIEAYPEKYSWGIARQMLGISGTASNQATHEQHRTVASAVVRDAGKEQQPNENSEYDLSDYDTLSKKSKNLRSEHAGNAGLDKPSAVPAAPVEKAGTRTPAAQVPPLIPSPASPTVSAAPTVPEGERHPASKSRGEKKEEQRIAVAERDRESKTTHLQSTLAGRNEVDRKQAAKPVREKDREAVPSVTGKKGVHKEEKNVAAEKKNDRQIEKTVIAERKTGQKIEKKVAADKKTEKSSVGKEVKTEEKELKPGKTKYKVQVASYREREKADQVARKLKELGYTTRVLPMDLPGKGRWYRITISGLPSHQKAEEAVAKVEKKIGGSKGFIRPEDEEEDKAAVAAIARKKADEAAAKKDGAKKKTTDATRNRTQGAAN